MRPARVYSARHYRVISGAGAAIVSRGRRPRERSAPEDRAGDAAGLNRSGQN